MDGARSTEVKGVLADAHVPRVVALSLRNMRELVLDRRAFPQSGAARNRVELLAPALLQPLVFGDRDRPAVAECRGGALATQGAVITEIRIKLDGRATCDRLDLAVGARDRAVAQIQRKRGLRR